jgi:phage FluMu gp28-like protein
VRGKWDDAFAYLPEDVRRHAIAGWIAEQLQPHLERLVQSRRHVFAQDFARNRDQSVMVVADGTPDLTHRPRITVELANCPFSVAAAGPRAHHGRALPRWRGGAVDATGNGAALGEALAQRFGVLMVEQVKFKRCLLPGAHAQTEGCAAGRHAHRPGARRRPP